jgi:hypothetical protein
VNQDGGDYQALAHLEPQCPVVAMAASDDGVVYAILHWDNGPGQISAHIVKLPATGASGEMTVLGSCETWDSPLILDARNLYFYGHGSVQAFKLP